MSKRVAIIGGTGAQGFGLALRFARAGATVRIGSRDLEKARVAAQRVAELTGATDVEGRPNAGAVAECDIAILTVPLAAQIATLKSIRASFRPGAILVDVTVPLEAAIGGPSTQTLTLWPGSAAQQAARHVPDGVAVVAAFHSLGADSLAQLDRDVDCDVLICGDNPEAKAAVRELAGMLPGARAIDAGGLENARIAESLTALLISINVRYKVKHAGIRITGLET